MKLFVIILTMFGTLGAIELRLPEQKAVASQPFQILVAAQGEDVEFDSVETIGGYEVVQTNRVKNTLFINNQISYESRLVMSIYPEDDFVIEPIGAIVDGEQVYTKQMQITVEKDQINNQEQYFMHLSSDKKSVYEKEGFVVTMKLFESKAKSLLDILYSPPSKEGFFVKQLGNEKTYEEGEYRVHEIRYLYYPQNSGDLQIKQASARIGVPVKTRDFFGEATVPKHRNISSNALDIQVKPLPQRVDLVGEVDLKVEMSTTQVAENEPLFLDIKLEGRANFDDFVGFDIDIAGVTVFEGAQEIAFDRFEQSFSLIAQQSFEIPSFEVMVFDTNDEVVKVLSSKPLSVAVDTQQVPQPTAQTVVVEKEVTAVWKVALALVFGVMIGVLATLFLVKKSKKRQPKQWQLLELLPYCDDKEVFDLAKKIYHNEEKIDKKQIDAVVKKVSN